jgi:hypothetical protein
MTPERLAEIDIAIAAFRDAYPGSFGGMIAELRAEVVRLTPRQITTVEEIEALPMYAVVTDPDGDAWQKRYDDDQPWVMAGLASEPEADQTLLTYAPLLLVHTPQAQAENTA